MELHLQLKSFDDEELRRLWAEFDAARDALQKHLQSMRLEVATKCGYVVMREMSPAATDDVEP